MQIGIGLPNPVPGTLGRLLVDWARSAEEAGFSTLATIDRIAYPSYESLTVLAAAAGATERIGLLTNILIGPTRNPVLLAKEAQSVYQVSGGRFVLGLGVGGRDDDYAAAEQPFEERGKRFDRQLDLMRRAWRGEPIEACNSAVNPGPPLDEGVPILMGGTSDAAIRRTAEHAIGWTAGGSAPDQVAPMARRVRQAWGEAGRAGSPRIVALTYYSLGDDAEAASRQYVEDYYRFTGMGDQIAEWVPRTPEAIRERMQQFEEAGIDELVFDPTVAELHQVDRLAETVL